MIIPYAHLAHLDQADKKTTDEMMDLTKRCQTALRDVYRPNGFNLGMNLGRRPARAWPNIFICISYPAGSAMPIL